ncbi:hypothetical protein ABTE35_19595, partial [Acinetobacter baumannii]
LLGLYDGCAFGLACYDLLYIWACVGLWIVLLCCLGFFGVLVFVFGVGVGGVVGGGFVGFLGCFVFVWVVLGLV